MKLQRVFYVSCVERRELYSRGGYRVAGYRWAVLVTLAISISTPFEPTYSKAMEQDIIPDDRSKWPGSDTHRGHS